MTEIILSLSLLFIFTFTMIHRCRYMLQKLQLTVKIVPLKKIEIYIFVRFVHNLDYRIFAITFLHTLFHEIQLKFPRFNISNELRHSFYFWLLLEE
jgi:hypothetical protein